MAQCMYPYMVEQDTYFSQEDRYIPVPCGKCPACLKRRVASWSHRLEMEGMRWAKRFFVTLTYNTDHVPISENKFLTLKPDDVTRFFKRLRKIAGKCRYYYCGEYGTQHKRPHYHLIIYATTAMEQQDIVSAWYEPVTKTPYGDVYFGQVEAGSIRYTVQYYDKGVWTKAHRRDDREPEFSRMSNGIGSNFLSPEMVKHLLANPDKGYIYDHEGRKIAIPRYYKKKLYDYVGSDIVVANHPSILVHRDEMLDAKERHHAEIQKILDGIEVEEDNAQRNEDRKQAILNYRESKRKTRK